MARKVLRTTAEGSLRSLGCSSTGKTQNPLGQWWSADWGHHEFFLMWEPPDGNYVDEQHLRTLLVELQRLRPIQDPPIN